MTGKISPDNPEVSYYVLETFQRAGGGSITDFADGPFATPDQARIARDRVREETPDRNVHCAEFRVYG